MVFARQAGDKTFYPRVREGTFLLTDVEESTGALRHKQGYLCRVERSARRTAQASKACTRRRLLRLAPPCVTSSISAAHTRGPLTGVAASCRCRAHDPTAPSR